MSCKVLVIVGPTASGKSSLGIELAKKFNGEIINGDSVSVYKELTIGSAKTTEAEMDGVVHHLVDCKQPTEDNSVADFQKEARAAIEEIQAKGKLPIVVGGTGLYIKALLYDYEFIEMASSHTDYETLSTEQLYRQLLDKDPESTKKIHPNNRKRIIRALQIAESGNLKSEIEEAQQHQPVYDSLIIGLTMDRDLLKERIDKRVDQMIQDGLEREVRDLFSRYPQDLRCFSAIGYKEFIPYINGMATLAETVTQIKTHTRQFAKRQYTWFRHQMDVNWYDIQKEGYRDAIEESVENWLSQ